MFEEFVLRRKQDGSHWHPPWSSEVVGKEFAEPRVAPEQLLKSMLRGWGDSQNWKESQVWQRIMNLYRSPPVSQPAGCKHRSPVWRALGPQAKVTGRGDVPCSSCRNRSVLIRTGPAPWLFPAWSLCHSLASAVCPAGSHGAVAVLPVAYKYSRSSRELERRTGRNAGAWSSCRNMSLLTRAGPRPSRSPFAGRCQVAACSACAAGRQRAQTTGSASGTKVELPQASGWQILRAGRCAVASSSHRTCRQMPSRASPSRPQHHPHSGKRQDIQDESHWGIWWRLWPIL